MSVAEGHVGRLRAPRKTAAPAVLGLAVLSFFFAGSVAQANVVGNFGGGAVSLSATAKTGPVGVSLKDVGQVDCPCEGTNGKIRRHQVQNVTAGPNGLVVRARIAEATTLTRSAAGSAFVRNTARTAGLRMLDGLITADEVVGAASLTTREKTMQAATGGSKFVNLRIAGRAISANVGPNTRVAIPGVGTVTLKKVIRGGDGRSTRTISVEMLSIHVQRANRFGLPVGARISVARANARFARTNVPVIVGGHAVVSAANVKSGRGVQTNLRRLGFVSVGGCGGTGGETRQDTIARLTAANIVNAGTGRTTAFSDIRPSLTTVRTTARVEGISLLGGLLRVAAVTAVAEDRITSSGRTSSTAGSRVAGVSFRGLPLPLPLPRPLADITTPNHRLDIPGVGFVILNERVVPPPGSKAPTRVNGIHLYVMVPNAFGLPVGSEIIIAQAVSRAFRSGFAGFDS